MRMIGIHVCAALAALLVIGCSGRPAADVPAHAAPAPLPDLAGSLAPLRSWFTAHQATPRALLLFSPG